MAKKHEDDMDAGLLRKIAHEISREAVKELALFKTCMGLEDSAVNEIENDYKKDIEFKYNIFIKWKNKTGATISDLQSLIIRGREEGILVGKKVFEIIGVDPPGKAMSRPTLANITYQTESCVSYYS